MHLHKVFSHSFGLLNDPQENHRTALGKIGEGWSAVERLTNSISLVMAVNRSERTQTLAFGALDTGTYPGCVSDFGDSQVRVSKAEFVKT